MALIIAVATLDRDRTLPERARPRAGSGASSARLLRRSLRCRASCSASGESSCSAPSPPTTWSPGCTTRSASSRFSAARLSRAASSSPGLILAIMVVPIVASICRELFVSVPRDQEEGALALGATRWEMVRGVVLSSSRPGIAAAVILGLGRAIGEAIAVTQVIGAGWTIQWSLFSTGDTLASRIAGQYQGAVSKMQISALFYLGAILLVIGLVTNFLAQFIVRRAAVAGGWPTDVFARPDGRSQGPRRAHPPAADHEPRWPRRWRCSRRSSPLRCWRSSSCPSPSGAPHSSRSTS